MADNYLEFFESLDELTPAEFDWLRQQLAEDPLTECPAFLADYEDREPDDPARGFEYHFHGDPAEALHLYAEENGDVGRTAHLVQKFLKAFRPEQAWSLTYAATCSKTRVGEFSGGAVFVTAEEITFHDAYDFIEDQQKAFVARRHTQRLLQKAETLNLEPEQLDEAVHEMASSIGSDINNGGTEAQLTYLVEHLGAGGTEKLLDDLAGSNKEENDDAL
jgi:hypothetical protein